jgi:hypothetical protein
VSPVSRPDAPLRIEVAGAVFEVSGLDAAGRAWATTRYGAFVTDRAPDFTLAVTVSDAMPRDEGSLATLDLDGDSLGLEVGGYRIEGDLQTGRLRLLAPPLPSVLSPATFRCLCALVLLRAGGVMLHASSVVDRRGAWVFCGASESGKTTVAQLAGARAVLSDETTAVRRQGTSYVACATPFFGEAGPVPAQASGEAPLTALFFLSKSTRFAHRPLARWDAVQRAFPQVFLPKRAPAMAEAILANLDVLTAAVPCFELEFAVRDELWSYVDAVA